MYTCIISEVWKYRKMDEKTDYFCSSIDSKIIHILTAQVVHPIAK